MNTYELDDAQEKFIRNLSLDDMNSITPEILRNKLNPYSTGFEQLFSNKNTILCDSKKLVEILEVFLERKQRLFEYTYYDILPYSDEVRDWVYKNLSVNNTKICIEDKENY
jgi:hypothetical protein